MQTAATETYPIWRTDLVEDFLTALATLIGNQVLPSDFRNGQSPLTKLILQKLQGASRAQAEIAWPRLFLWAFDPTGHGLVQPGWMASVDPTLVGVIDLYRSRSRAAQRFANAAKAAYAVAATQTISFASGEATRRLAFAISDAASVASHATAKQAADVAFNSLRTAISSNPIVDTWDSLMWAAGARLAFYISTPP